MARFLGALSTFGLKGKPLKKASSKAMNIDQKLISDGATLVANQDTCFEFLDRLRTQLSQSPNVPLLSEVFPQLLSMVRKQLREQPRNWMMRLLQAYVTYSSRAGCPIIWERKRHVDQTNLSKHARSSALASHLVKMGNVIPTRETISGRRKFLISDDQVAALRNQQHCMLSMKAAARYSGMSVSRIRHLVDAKRILVSGRRIDIASIDQLLSQIDKNCVRSNQPLKNYISIGDALRYYVPAEDTAAFFSMIIDSNARLVHTSILKQTLRSIYISRSDIDSYIEVAATSSQLLSIVEAARRLNIKQQVMYHLIDIGLIRMQTGKLSRRMARLVDSRDLDNFSKHFCPLVTVSKYMGIASRNAPAWARDIGLDIVTGPTVDGGRQYWIRTPADPSLLPRIRSTTANQTMLP
ncbi:hypothetical protein [Robbsia andropogonis]|uniref:hypothetical protein n=1 Tax=Robbsia andropogonis TaxID=28092 RepID=UPI0012FB3EA7|nr:hypothetical protein [Robbsia andropogonis]